MRHGEELMSGTILRRPMKAFRNFVLTWRGIALTFMALAVGVCVTIHLSNKVEFPEAVWVVAHSTRLDGHVIFGGMEVPHLFDLPGGHPVDGDLYVSPWSGERNCMSFLVASNRVVPRALQRTRFSGLIGSALQQHYVMTSDEREWGGLVWRRCERVTEEALQRIESGTSTIEFETRNR